jgi:hypothetical protein
MTEGGGLHPARPATGGGSDASQSSTELLRPEEDKDPNRYGGVDRFWSWAGLSPGPVLGGGLVSPSSLIFFFFYSFYFFIPGFNSSI